MLEYLKALALFTLLLLPNGEWPNPDTQEAFRLLPHPLKERVWLLACRENLAFPHLEEPSWEHFDGIAVILYRRYHGNPLPYPHDPVLGARGQP